MISFAERLASAVQNKQTPVLMGLDPRIDMIPDECFTRGKDGPEAIAEGFYQFGARLMESLVDHVAAVKPQIAFYEVLGLPGLEAYSRLLKKAKELDILSIADIKRGDIGSTSEAYAQAHLGGPSGDGPFEADAVTINPWLGGDSLEPYFKRCRDRGKGVYLLLHTSNPGSTDLQEKDCQSGQKLYQELGDLINTWQDEWTPDGEYSSIGAVVGATWPEQLIELQQRCPRTPFLVPGYGSQGGTGKDVAPLYQSESGQLPPHIINASRSLTYAYLKHGGSLSSAALKAAENMKADILG